MNKMSKIIVLVFLSLFTVESIAEVTMGIFPRKPAAKTFKFFKPLAEKIGQEIGEEVKMVVPKNFKAFWKDVQEGKYDIVHYNQYHYLLSKSQFGYEVFAVNEEFGSSKVAGALAVRKDSGITSVADMKGKTILFGGGKKAMGSYIATTAILKKAGLEAGKDYTEKFAKNPPGAVLGVYNKNAEVAGSGNVILKSAGVKSKIDVSEMTIVAESEPFIHLAWAASKNMPKDKVAKIQAVMTGLKGSNDDILKSAKVTNFIQATDADFAKAREIIKFVTGESL